MRSQSLKMRTLIAAACLFAGLGASATSAADASPKGPSANPGQSSSSGGPSSERPNAAEAIAAIVNDDLITTYDVRQRMLLIIASTGIQTNEQNLRQIKDQALRSLIEEHLQLQEARKFEVKISDQEIDGSIKAIAQQNGASFDDFKASFAKNGINLDSLREQIRADTAWRRIVNGRYGSRVKVSSARVKETLARLEASSSKPQYLLSEIFLYAEGDAEQTAALQGAGRLLEEMKKGAPFPVVARQFSSAPSAATGGDMGWIRSGELRPEVEAVVQNLQPGFVSEPIPVNGGVYLVALRDKRDGQSAIDRVTLKSIQIVNADPAAVKSLNRVRDTLSNCNAIDGASKRVSGATVVDFGELALNEMSGDMASRISPLQAGQTTPVFDQDGVSQVIMVCARRREAVGLPSPEEVENRLYEQELSMIARRWLRDLKRDSTIITR